MASLLYSVFPLVSPMPSDDAPLPEYCGTCFLLDDRQTIVTARHVIDPLIASDGAIAQSAVLASPETMAYKMRAWWMSPDYDIAVGRTLSPLAEGIPLRLAERFPGIDVDLVAIEFSQSRKSLDGNGSLKFVQRHSQRKGNIVELYDDDIPGPRRARYVDLNFPAFKGASGAPAFTEDGVVGAMILQNHERDLLPAQLITTKVESEVVEEVKYFLPLAKAITFEALRETMAVAVPALIATEALHD
jgi:hypothetical protein